VPSHPVAQLLRSAAPTLSAGILTANLVHLSADVALLEQAGVPLVHFDVMDGCFCPMMTLGPPVIKAVRTSLLKDVHLMIADPLEKVTDYVKAGADLITVHVESCLHIHRVLQAMAGLNNANDPDRGLARGIAINPGTPLEALDPLLSEVEMVLLLAVNPGWSGQAFISSTFSRMAKAREMIASSGRDVILAVDGGITRDNVGKVVAAGADLVVAGSAVFDGKTPLQNAEVMLTAIRQPSTERRAV
jgi:ribulose-phosphate 3-epimerase